MNSKHVLHILPPVSHIVQSFYFTLLTGLFLLCMPSMLRSQQNSLPCNTITPWIPPLFTVTEEHDSPGGLGGVLACWDGDALCIIPGTNPPANVIDASTSNMATGEILLGGSLILSVKDNVNNYDAGNFAGFVVSSELFELSVLNAITIRTYLDDILMDTYVVLDPIGISLDLFSGPFTVGFVTTQSYDEVEITITDILGIGFYSVHYAVMERFCEGPGLECNVHTAMNSPVFPMTIDYSNTGSGGISIGEVDDPENAISASTSDYASLINVASVLGSTFIAVEAQITNYPAGTFVGFDIENIEVVGAGVLEFITISSYLDGAFVESETGSGLLIGGTALSQGRQIVGFVTTQPVDKVKLTISQPVGVTLGTTRVYSSVFREFCVGPPLDCNVQTPIAMPDHPVFINGDHTGVTGIACVLCDVVNSGNVIDDIPGNYAEIILAVGVGPIGSLSVENQLTTYPAGTFTGFHIENPVLVDANVLSGITITTYLNGVLQESETNLGALVTVGTDILVNTGEQIVGIVTTEEFDEVRISLSNLASLNLGTTLIHEFIVGAFCEAEIECDTTYYLTIPEFPVYIDFLLTGVDGVACVACEIEDAQNVITASNSDFATITLTANVIGSASIAVRDALFTYPPGTFAGFVIEDESALIEVDLFESITISTYLDGDLQEFRSGGDLIDLAVLILFISAEEGRYNVGFNTTLPFDEIRITAASVVTADPFTELRVYSAFVDTRGSEGEGGLNCCVVDAGADQTGVCAGATANLTAVIPSTGIWSGHTGNPSGATVLNLGGGNANVTFSETANGIYLFVYAKNAACSDTVSITVANCAPDAVDDVAIANEDTSVSIDVTDNDSSPENEDAIPEVIDPPTHGSAVLNPADSTITYTPDPDFVGQDTFTYAICDAGIPVLCDTAQVVITVVPVIDTIYVNVPEDSTLTVCADSLTTFTEPAASIAICDPPSNGTIQIVGTCITYTPDDNFTGLDTMCVVACNEDGVCDTTIVIIDVGGQNDPPIAVDDNTVTDEDTPVSIDVLANDSDQDSPLNNPEVLDEPTNGTATVDPMDGTILYTPDPDFVGQDTFTYEICDDGIPVYCDTAQVVVTVLPVIDTIIITVPEDSMVTVCADSLTTFTEPAVSISVCNPPSNGTVQIIGTCVTYTPDTDFTGMDTMCVVACNEEGVCDTTIVIIIVTPVNDPPVAIDDIAFTDEDTPVSIDVLSNDSDPDSPLNDPEVIDEPTNGTATVDPMDGTILYTPDPDFVGQDTFTYEICDDGLPVYCDTAQVVITVLPVIDTIITTVPEDSMVMVCADSLTTFTEPAVSISICDPPSNGTTQIIGTCVTYTPDGDFTGMDTMCVVSCNEDGVCDTTIVIIIVTPVNDPPIAVDDSAVTDEDTPVSIDVLSNDSDLDSPLDIPDVVDPPTNGTTLVNPVDSTITYTPDPDFVGQDTFTYAICDAGLPVLCDTAQVIITVVPVIDTIYVNVPEDSTVTVCADSLTTFTTPAESIAICDPPSNGSVQIIGTCVTYTPVTDFTGLDTICVVACNEDGVCDTTIVIIDVGGQNDPPVAVDDAAVTNEDTPVSIDVLANDSDPDSPLNEPEVIDEPTNGTATVDPMDGTILYTPDPDFVGQDTFTYEICDDGLPLYCDTAQVIITVLPVTDTIVVIIPEDSTLVICADSLTTFTEPAENILVCDPPSNGSIVIIGTCVMYTPDSNFVGADTICLVVCDKDDICDTTIVIIVIDPFDDPPVAVDDFAVTNEDTPVSIDVLANDSDPDSPLGSPEVVDPPGHGVAVLNPVDSTFTYTPDPDFVGQDTFTYAICDDLVPPSCDTAQVVITVLPVIDTITITIPEDSTLTVCADSLTTFTEPAESISICDPPSNGTTSITGTCLIYTPDVGFTGMDTICVVACNDDGVCDTTIVIIIVTPVNNPPVALDDADTTDEDTPISVDVLANDSDEDSPLGIPVVLDPPDNGSAMVNPLDSSIIYTPDPDFVGVDTFTYAICDDGMPPLCDTAEVVITILPVTDTIVVIITNDDSTEHCAEGMTTFTIPASTIDVCEDPEDGTIIVIDSCITYVPDSGFVGIDTICLVVCHPEDLSMCDTTIVIIIVEPPVCLMVQTWVYLEGSAVVPNGEMQYSLPMRNTLNDILVLPGQCYEDFFFGIKCSPPGQPYSIEPWNYMGAEGALYDSGGDPLNGDAGYPGTVVDWVLVSLRDNAEGVGGPICQVAALLHHDGLIEFVEDFECCGLDAIDSLYIVIEHRNHLIVMSDEPVPVVNNTLTYDFRNQQSYINDPQGFGSISGQKEIIPGVYAMFAGNGNQTLSDQSDTDINFDDRTFWEDENGSFGVYRIGDYNLNADTNFNDRVVWALNNGKFTSVIRE